MVIGRALLVTAIVASSACHDPDKYQLLSPANPGGTAPSSVIDLVPQATSIPANGGSRTRIEARIDPSSTVRTVSFETTRGTLLAGGRTSTTATPAVDVPVDTSGVAAAELQSTTEPGTARVTAKIAIPNTTPQTFFTQTVDITFTPVNVGEMITLTATPATAEADGATLIHVTATISPSLPLGSRTVTFEATGGRFATGTVNGNTTRATVTADAGHTASVDLVAPQVSGSVAITASVSTTFTARTTVTFNRAAPDVVFVELDQGSVAKAGNDAATVTVVLLRDVGQVADNTPVTFSAVDSAGTRIGIFEKIMLGRVEAAEGTAPKRVIATADFNPEDAAALGVATITATVTTATGASRSGTATITIQ